MIQLDYRDKRPIYEQVVEKLEHLIASGALEADEKMPSVRSLGLELAVNPNTIQRAYNRLEQDGYLYTVTGRGSFVSPRTEWEDSRAALLLEEWRQATRAVAEAGLTEVALAVELHHIYEEDAQ